MLRMNVMETAQRQWVSSMMFAPKKDGSLGFCIDYRKMNSVTFQDAYQIPRMDECLDSIGEGHIFSM